MRNRLAMTSNESLLVAMDFSPQMADDETIAASNANGTTAVTAIDSAGAAASIIETGSMTIVGQTLQVRLEELTAVEKYTVKFIAATSAGNVLEQWLQVTA